MAPRMVRTNVAVSLKLIPIQNYEDHSFVIHPQQINPDFILQKLLNTGIWFSLLEHSGQTGRHYLVELFGYIRVLHRTLSPPLPSSSTSHTSYCLGQCLGLLFSSPNGSNADYDFIKFPRVENQNTLIPTQSNYLDTYLRLRASRPNHNLKVTRNQKSPIGLINYCIQNIFKVDAKTQWSSQ